MKDGVGYTKRPDMHRNESPDEIRTSELGDRSDGQERHGPRSLRVSDVVELLLREGTTVTPSPFLLMGSKCFTFDFLPLFYSESVRLSDHEILLRLGREKVLQHSFHRDGTRLSGRKGCC